MCPLKDEDSVQRNTGTPGSNQHQFVQELLKAQRTFSQRFRSAPDLCTELFIHSNVAEEQETEEVTIVRVAEGRDDFISSAEGNEMLDMSKVKIEVTNRRASEA